MTRKTFRGTHQGELMGIPPTGRTVEMAIMDIARLVDGKVVETWHMGEDLSMLQQLGVLQSPEPTNR